MANHDYKFDAGKSRVDLLVPEFIEEMGQVLSFGATKYRENSWKTLRNSKTRYLGAMFRHVLGYMKGKTKDEESGVDTLAQIAVNAMFLYWLNKREEKKSGSKA